MFRYYSLVAEADVTCQVYDIAGRMVHNETFKASKGGNGMLMDFSSFKNDYYILKLTGKGIEDSYKFKKNNSTNNR
ncbi:hypothetical protein [Taibaiella lutea]|nr:hypothetical protein [Taibaiella lutea]